MPIQLNEENCGKILVLQASESWQKKTTSTLPEFEQFVRQHGKLRVLFDMIGFHGWEAGALWEDIKFDSKPFADIERFAMVGENKWQQGRATF